MPVLLRITASSDEIRRARKSRFLNFQQITMPYLAARVPPGWQVTHIDEEAEEDIDWTDQPDVVDDELLDAAARSGCKPLFLGLESVSQSSMVEVRKGFNRVEDDARVINRVHSHGMAAPTPATGGEPKPQALL